MHTGFKRLDPHWQQFAASLRKDQIYVKMPLSKARALGAVWDILSKKIMFTEPVLGDMIDLIKLIADEAVGSQTYGISSVFYMVSTDQCGKDIEVLGNLIDKDQTGVFKLFKESLERGLKSDPDVDWIARVGGPKAHPFEALQSESETVDLSYEDLFGDSNSDVS
jgi:hypothetical protein